MESGRTGHRRRSDLRIAALAVLMLLAYWLVSLAHLTVFPPVGQDEPWIAAAPYKLAAEGVYGSDLFAGYFRIDERNYQHMPLYPLLQAAIFKAAGVGVFQMRFLPVACGMLVLPLTFALGRQMADQQVGILAMALLIGLRLSGGWQGGTGIPLLDTARINRYDIAVPLFGLAALWSFNQAERQRMGRGYVLSGVLVGLSGLCHLYGAFWLAALLLILGLRRGRRVLRQPAPYRLVLGFALAWLPWAAYVASGWNDYVGQMQFVASRFDVLNPRFYVDNVLREVERYRMMDLRGPQGRLRLGRPGSWAFLLGLPAALGVMLGRARSRPNGGPFALAVALIIQAAMFALLLRVKYYNYAIALFPLAFLALAWLGVWLWRHRASWIYRGGLLALLILILAEGGSRVAHTGTVAARTTPYDEFERAVAAHIPPGSLVVGLQHHWLGLRQYRYRTWLLPLLRTGDATDLDGPVTLDRALEGLDPDVILLDEPMSAYLQSVADVSHPEHEIYAGWRRFLARHRVILVGTVEDGTYGTMRIYEVAGLSIDEGDAVDLWRAPTLVSPEI